MVTYWYACMLSFNQSTIHLKGKTDLVSYNYYYSQTICSAITVIVIFQQLCQATNDTANAVQTCSLGQKLVLSGSSQSKQQILYDTLWFSVFQTVRHQVDCLNMESVPVSIPNNELWPHKIELWNKYWLLYNGFYISLHFWRNQRQLWNIIAH